MPRPRPSFPLNDSAIGTDAWASTSAAFSIGSLLYTPGYIHNYSTTSLPPSEPSLANLTYAKTLLGHAESLYITAKTHTPYTPYSDSVPALGEAYGSTSWADDLTLSALALSLATNNSQYYADAYKFYVTYNLTGSQQPFDWDHRFAAVYQLFVEVALSRPSLAIGAGLDVNLTGWQTEAEAYYDRMVNQQIKNGFLTPGGLLYITPESPYDSLQIATAIAFLLFKYAPIASTAAKTQAYNVSVSTCLQPWSQQLACYLVLSAFGFTTELCE